MFLLGDSSAASEAPPGIRGAVDFVVVLRKEIEKEQNIMQRKEDNIRGIYRTLEKNTYLTEKKKQDWIDKALEYEEKLRQK